MIDQASGNLLRADVDALVNTVNCVGFMGKGIALQFKQAYPENYRAYQAACRAGEVVPGRMFVHVTGLLRPRYIINFPTKRHWRGKSRLEDIKSGLVALVADIRRLGIDSIAIPPLGCGNGGLRWAVVEPLIHEALASLGSVKALLYAPVGAPSPDGMPIGTDRPHLTPSRALLIKLIQQYRLLEYRTSLLEIQKLAYFLQEGGEGLRLAYEAGRYGPYARNLNKVLERLEGHFIRGLGDSQRPETEIVLLAGAIEESDAFLAGRTESLDRLRRVAELIDGFETPYGMELLASVHWVVRRQGVPATDVDGVHAAIEKWNERKKKIFQRAHITTALTRLREQDWVGADDPVVPA